MVFYCSVPLCKNSAKSCKMHRFPIDEELFIAWLTRIKSSKLEGKEKDKIRSNYRICDIHFANDCRIIGRKGANLKYYSVPSMHLPYYTSGKDSEDDEPLIDIGSKNATPVLVPTTNLVDEVNDTESNSITNSEIISEDRDKENSCSKDKGNIRCRTCFEYVQESHFLTDVVHVTKTIKEMIMFCVPQMASTLFDDNVVCNKCLDAIQFCVKFIENCLEVEKKIQDFNREENTSEHNDQENRNSLNTIVYVETEHDYSTKSESSSLENLLANQQLSQCPNSDMALKSQQRLDNHAIRVHSKMPVDEEAQERVTGLKSNDETCPQAKEYLHVKAREKFKCSRCGKWFQTKNNLLIHLRTVHYLSKRPVAQYICKFCQCSFLGWAKYKLHLKKHNICRVFLNKQKLQNTDINMTSAAFVSKERIQQIKLRKLEEKS